MLVAAGRHIINIDDVRQMVAEPDNTSILSSKIYLVPSHGLYLANVEYNDKGMLNQMLVTSCLLFLSVLSAKVY